MRIIRAGRHLSGTANGATGPVEIRIDDAGRIAAVLQISLDMLSPEEAGLLLLPALSNAHDHGRGLSPLAFGAEDQPLESWVVALRRQPRLDPYLNAAVAFGRLAESGVAAVNHCHNTQDSGALLAEAEAVSRAARDVGIRVAFAWPFFDRNPLVYGDLEPLLARLPEDMRSAVRAEAQRPLRTWRENMALMEKARAYEHETFQIQYHPVGPQWVQEETLEAIARASGQDGRRIHMHLFETQRQRQWADRAYPAGLLAYLDAIGLLSPRLTVAHAVWLRDEEMALLAERGVTVSVNVSSNLRLRSGLPPIARLDQAGVMLAYGLDGMALDDDQDMLRELRLAQFIAGSWAEPCCPDVLRGSWRAARCSILGEDGGGRLAVGAPADLMLLDFDELSADSLVTDPDPAPLLLARAQRRHVIQLFVGGRQVVDGGRCRTIDLPKEKQKLLKEGRATVTAAAPSLIALGSAIERYYDC